MERGELLSTAQAGEAAAVKAPLWLSPEHFLLHLQQSLSFLLGINLCFHVRWLKHWRRSRWGHLSRCCHFSLNQLLARIATP